MLIKKLLHIFFLTAFTFVVSANYCEAVVQKSVMSKIFSQELTSLNSALSSIERVIGSRRILSDDLCLPSAIVSYTAIVDPLILTEYEGLKSWFSDKNFRNRDQIEIISEALGFDKMTAGLMIAGSLHSNEDFFSTLDLFSILSWAYHGNLYMLSREPKTESLTNQALYTLLALNLIGKQGLAISQLAHTHPNENIKIINSLSATIKMMSDLIKNDKGPRRTLSTQVLESLLKEIAEKKQNGANGHPLLTSFKEAVFLLGLELISAFERIPSHERYLVEKRINVTLESLHSLSITLGIGFFSYDSKLLFSEPQKLFSEIKKKAGKLAFKSEWDDDALKTLASYIEPTFLETWHLKEIEFNDVYREHFERIYPSLTDKTGYTEEEAFIEACKRAAKLSDLTFPVKKRTF